MGDIERFDRELLKGNTTTIVLALLAECGPMHGYDLAKEMRRRGGEPLRLGQGVLYPILHRLERQGLVSGEWEPRIGSPSRKRYTLTTAGLEALRRKRAEWRAFAAAMERILEPQMEPAHG